MQHLFTIVRKMSNVQSSLVILAENLGHFLYYCFKLMGTFGKKILNDIQILYTYLFLTCEYLPPNCAPDSSRTQGSPVRHLVCSWTVGQILDSQKFSSVSLRKMKTVFGQSSPYQSLLFIVN